MEGAHRARWLLGGMVLGAAIFGAGMLAERCSARSRDGRRDADRHEDADEAPADSSADRVPRGRVPAEAHADTTAPEVTDRRRWTPRQALVVHVDADEGSPTVGSLVPGVEVRILEIRDDAWLVGRADGSTRGWVFWRRPLGVYGTATVKGVVRFTGKAPTMRVPKKRNEAEYCKDKPVLHDAVEVEGDRLKGVFVQLAPDSDFGDYVPPTRPVVIDQVDCMFSPRVSGALVGQSLEVRNEDGTLHDVHAYRGAESWFDKALPKGSAPLVQPLPGQAMIVKLASDVHPWMRAFVVVSPHPFFAVTGPDGTFSLERVPKGRYAVRAWHAHYGAKTRAAVQVDEGGTVTVDFTYDGTEPEPPENPSELADLF